MIRWIIEQSTRFKIPFRVEITDSEYSGSPIELEVAGQSPLITDGGQRNADPLRKVFGEGVEVRMRGKEGDFDDLFTRDNERFRIKVYRDGEFDSEYIPLTDASSEPVTKGTYEFTLQGRGLASLKEVKVLDILPEGRHTYLDGVYDIVNHFFDYDVVDGSIYYPSGANQNTSILSQITFSTDRWDEETTAYEALESLMMKTHQLRVHEGDIVVVPVTSASFTGYRYNGTSISSGITFDNNFIAEKIGGRLSTIRSKIRAFDGVQRNYQPLEAPNLIVSGKLESIDDFNVLIPFPRQGFPVGWENVQGGLGRILASDDFQRNLAWSFRFAPTREWRTAQNKSIVKGQRLRFGTTVRVNSDARNTWSVLFKITMGDYVLTRPVQINDLIQGNVDIQDLEWKLQSEVSFPEDYIFVNVDAGSIQDKTLQIPPAPVTDELVFHWRGGVPSAIYLYDLAGESLSATIRGVSPTDTVELHQAVIDAVDEDGEIIRESTSTTGEGDLYEYTEIFGDGFTSVNPGAIFFNDAPTDKWKVKGLEGEFPLGDLQTKYIFNDVTEDRDKIQGTVDTFDTLALIEGKRVNYIRTDWRYGRSEIELVEIQDHDLEATSEDRRDQGDGNYDGGPGIDDRFDPDELLIAFQKMAIGELLENVSGSVTEIKLRLSTAIQAGKEYFIVNGSELKADDKDAGIYPFNPVPTLNGDVVDRDTEDATLKYGPGAEVTVPIRLGDDPVYINAPEGSPVVKTPGQEETDDNVYEERIEEGEERIRELNEEKLPLLDEKLDDLEDALQDLDDNLDILDGKLDDLDDEIENLNDNVLPDLQNQLNTLDGFFDDPSTIPSGYNFFEGIVAENIFVLELVARQLFTDELAANTVFTDELVANNAFINELVTRQLFTDELVANNAFINELVTRQLFTDELVANDVFTDALIAKEAWIDELTANIIDVGDLYARDAVIGATLTLGSDAEFTNSNNDFFVNEDGFEVRPASVVVGGAIPFGRSYKVATSGGTPIMAMYGSTSDEGFLTMPRSDSAMNIVSGVIGQSPAPDPSDMNVFATGALRFQSKDLDQERAFMEIHENIKLEGDNFDVEFEESDPNNTSPSGDTGRIRVRVGGLTRWIKLYS